MAATAEGTAATAAGDADAGAAAAMMMPGPAQRTVCGRGDTTPRRRATARPRTTPRRRAAAGPWRTLREREQNQSPKTHLAGRQTGQCASRRGSGCAAWAPRTRRPVQAGRCGTPLGDAGVWRPQEPVQTSPNGAGQARRSRLEARDARARPAAPHRSFRNHPSGG